MQILRMYQRPSRFRSLCHRFRCRIRIRRTSVARNSRQVNSVNAGSNAVTIFELTGTKRTAGLDIRLKLLLFVVKNNGAGFNKRSVRQFDCAFNDNRTAATNDEEKRK